MFVFFFPNFDRQETTICDVAQNPKKKKRKGISEKLLDVIFIEI
jgi:hypothetical protein